MPFIIPAPNKEQKSYIGIGNLTQIMLKQGSN